MSQAENSERLLHASDTSLFFQYKDIKTSKSIFFNFSWLVRAYILVRTKQNLFSFLENIDQNQ